MKEQPKIANRPVITLITATYNAEAFLENTIQSVLEQTYPHIQYIIIDGGSTDNTVKIIKKYERHLHYWVSEKDKGVYNAWNKGVARAGGDWISFIGADDFLLNKHVIEESVKELNLAFEKGIRYVYAKVQVISRRGDAVLAVWGTPWEEARKKIFRYMTVNHCGAFHHKSLFESYGNFNESFKITGDYEFVLREFARNGHAHFINKSMVAMRDGGLSANVKLKLTVARENIKALGLNNLPITWHQKKQLYKAATANLILKLLGTGTLQRLSDVYKGFKKKH